MPYADPALDSLGEPLPSMLLPVVNSLATAAKHAQEDEEWSKKKFDFLGDVAGVAASDDFLYVFHRANVSWNER